jgi:hypothetical protein
MFCNIDDNLFASQFRNFNKIICTPNRIFKKMRRFIFILFLFLNITAFSQETLETKRYAIEVAGIKVGEMHATKRTLGKGLVKYHVKSDVKVNLLVYTLKIKYEVISQFDKNGLVYSEAKVNSNKGDFFTTTVLNRNKRRKSLKKLSVQTLLGLPAVCFLMNQPIISRFMQNTMRFLTR